MTVRMTSRSNGQGTDTEDEDMVAGVWVKSGRCPSKRQSLQLRLPTFGFEKVSSTGTELPDTEQGKKLFRHQLTNFVETFELLATISVQAARNLALRHSLHKRNKNAS